MVEDDTTAEEPQVETAQLSSTTRSLSQAAGNLLERVLGPAADEIGGHLAEQYRSWRWRRKNIETIAEMHEEEVRRRGINPEQLIPLSEGAAFRLMDACSLEDDETVQKLWAGLITSAMDPNDKAAASKVFVDILKSIGPGEAGLLLVLHKIDTIRVEPKSTDHKVWFEAQKDALQQLNEFAELVWRQFGSEKVNATQNLMRLRCVGFRTGKQLTEGKLLSGTSYREEVRVDPRGVAVALDYVENLALAASGTRDMPSRSNARRNQLHFPEATHELTPLGRSLMVACLADGEMFPLGGANEEET